MRAAAGALGVASLALGIFLAAHHVLSPTLAVALFLAWSGAVFWRPWWWLVGVPASLPLIAFAPRTGVLITEEWDLVVLGAAAGAYAAHALRRASPALPEAGEGARVSPGWWTVMGLFVVSALVALWRGVADAGAIDLAWTQGYYDTLNSVRVEKGLALALLVVPLLRSELRAAGTRTVVRIAVGFAVAGAVAAAWVVWERAAFPGVLNFSTDYRVTGPFWEMHVGGAALDGFLALTLPFTIFALLRARRATALAAALVGVGLVLYAGLVTFSRGVYLALPASLVVLAVLLRTRPDSGHPPLTLAGAASAIGFGVGAAAASFLAFQAGGYRGLGAALGAFALGLSALELGRGTRARDWLLAAVLGGVAATLAIGVAALLPKGTYALYAVAAAACGGVLWCVRQGNVALRPLALATLCWLIAMAVAVPVSWAGEGALEGAIAAVALFVVLAVWMARAPFATRRARWQVQILTVGAATLLAAVVAVFTGGAYMAGRFATGSTDLDERIHHWRDGLAMLDGPADWLLGKGAGRFPENYLFHVRDSVFPGSYRLDAHGSKAYLTLSGPRYPTSFGDLFRVSQRVAARPGAYVLTLSARAAEDVRLHVEICEKHLLYTEGCGITLHAIRGAPGTWQRLTIPFDASAVTGGPWYAHRPAYFSLAMETSGKSVDLAGVSLVGPDRQEVLANGDFTHGMAHWFFSSDRYHLPWHIKSLPLNVLYDQGWIGLLLFTVLVVAVLVRLAFGRARGRPAAPFIAAALVGFLVVGAFDSLTDVPRVAFAFWLVLFLGALIDGRARGAAVSVTGTRP